MSSAKRTYGGWWLLFALYNFALVLVSAVSTVSAFASDGLPPEAGPVHIGADIFWSVLFFDVCFGICGPGIEWAAGAVVGRRLDWRIPLIVIGLPLGIVLQWFSMQLTLTPF
jgi:hypothetical protein